MTLFWAILAVKIMGNYDNDVEYDEVLINLALLLVFSKFLKRFKCYINTLCIKFSRYLP